MKTLGLKHLFFIGLLFLSFVGVQAQERVVEQPAFDAWNSTTLDIDKIVLSDTATVFHIDASYRPKFWIMIAKETYLLADGKNYPIKAGDGIGLSEKFWMPESGETSFRLIFPPLPKGTKTIDFIEGAEPNAFHIWGIRLDGTRPEAALPTTIATARNAVLEEPVLKAGTGMLSGKIIGYRAGMFPQLTAYVSNLLTVGSDEHKIDISSDGEFRLEIPLVSTTQVSLYSNSLHLICYLKPGETTTVEINLPEICRLQSKKRASQPSLGDKYLFRGALADLNNERANQAIKEPTFGPDSRESYMQMMKEISSMTLDQYAAYWNGKYQKAQEEARALTSISEAWRKLIDMKLKHELADQLLSYGMIEYAYREVNNIPKDSLLADRPELLPGNDYFKFLPELLPNDLYFVYDGGSSFLLSRLRYTNFTGKKMQSTDPRSFPDNTADLARLMGSSEGLLFDLLAAQRLAASINEFKPLNADELARTEALHPTLKEALLAMNEKLKRTIEENKKKSGYTVNRVNIADIPAEELFNAIITPYRGKVVFVDFWATWCGPCKAAMKEAEPVKKDFAGKEIVFLYLAGENSPKGSWEQMIPDIKGEHYRMTDAQWDYICQKFGVRGVPSYMIISKEGTPTHFQVGFMGAKRMKEMLMKELSDASAD